jgi:light-regulated signal transduction histidine kinase (bacteriophytochrome)
LDLKIIVDEVVEDMELILKESNAKIIVRSMPHINGFPIQLRQLFFNCFVTLLKTMKSSPEIIIETEITDCVDFTVPNKKFHKLAIIAKETKDLYSQKTTPFFLIANNKLMPEEIGSTICERIMKNHMGIMEYESIPEKESSFHLYFPV